MTKKGYNAKSNSESVYAIRAFLIMANRPEQTSAHHKALEDEMIQLATTAGLQTVEVVSQNLRDPNARTLIGSGKVLEIAEFIKSHPEIDANDRDNKSIDIVLFGCDLTPIQQRNLEKSLDRRVFDRAELILDIFAQHAVTRDGKIQVELAQLQYLKPKLIGRGRELSKLGGGIGTRGPGETQLEVDRRRIEIRIRKLKEEYKKCREVGKVQRRARKREGLVSVSFVGYTNAGKSTLLNRLTKSKVVAKDQLFCTLDTTTRRLFLNDGTRLLLSDTVGFIEDLPAPLLGAFRATLAEVVEADALILVLDASCEDAERHIEAVNGILRDLESDDKPMLTILNKRDRVKDESLLKYLQHTCKPSITFSALHDKDLNLIFEEMKKLAQQVRDKMYNKKPEKDDEESIALEFKD